MIGINIKNIYNLAVDLNLNLNYSNMNINTNKANKTNMLLTNTMQNGYTFDHTQLLSQY